MKYFIYQKQTRELIQLLKTKDTKPEDIELKEDEILAILGQNQDENDYLVRHSHPEDFWFHVEHHPSGHAIYKGAEIDTSAVIEIAKLAKGQSKLKETKDLSVIYTKIKNLRLTDTKGLVFVINAPDKIVV